MEKYKLHTSFNVGVQLAFIQSESYYENQSAHSPVMEPENHVPVVSPVSDPESAHPWQTRYDSDSRK